VEFLLWRGSGSKVRLERLTMGKPRSAYAVRKPLERLRAVSLIVGLALGGILPGAGSAPATPGDTLYVREEGLALRAEPRADAASKGALRRGQKVLEFARDGDWIRVGVFGAVGLEGWLPTAALGPTPENRDDTDGVQPRTPEARDGDEPAGGVTPPAAARARFDLTIAGSPGLAYAGECRIVAEDGSAAERDLRGLVPARHRFAGAALRCLLRKRDAFGRLIVALRRDGRPVARVETAAPYNYVRVRSDGPWGEARAIRGAVAVPQVVPSTRPVPTVPPLRGPIVPPLSGARGGAGGIPSIPPAP
jgi:hypothetical protein